MSKTTSMTNKRIAIIGAGPIGLECAIYASQLGFDLAVFEKHTVGSNILKWGHVSLFSPWKMNRSELGVRLLASQQPGWTEPDPEAILTGKEYVQAYLRPLCETNILAGKIQLGSEIISIGRRRALKGDLIAKPERGDLQFRLLVRHKDGTESTHFADIVIDASGVYDTPNWLGDGGIPAPGETTLRHEIDYHIPDMLGIDRQRFAGKKTLLIGAGYSAATAVGDFLSLMGEEPTTSLIWAIRQNRRKPIAEIENDALPSRANLTRRANAAVDQKAIDFRNGTTVNSIRYDRPTGTFEVTLYDRASKEGRVSVERIIANVGYGPDNSIYRELQVHECWATRGPMKLAASLLSSSSADCLAQESSGAATLKNPEPNFYIIGNKSYGRNPTFLIQTGLSQIVDIFTLITDTPGLNLHQSEQAIHQ